MLPSFLKKKTYVHPSDISKRSQLLRHPLKKLESLLAQVHSIQLITTPAPKLSFKIHLWLIGRICQQMRCVWLHCAYRTDDSAEIRKAAVSYNSTLYLAWGMLGLKSCIEASLETWKQHSEPLPCLSKPNVSLLMKRKYIYKAFWNV